jgi:hypothetical protein
VTDHEQSPPAVAPAPDGALPALPDDVFEPLGTRFRFSDGVRIWVVRGGLSVDDYRRYKALRQQLGDAPSDDAPLAEREDWEDRLVDVMSEVLQPILVRHNAAPTHACPSPAYLRSIMAPALIVQVVSFLFRSSQPQPPDWGALLARLSKQP